MLGRVIVLDASFQCLKATGLSCNACSYSLLRREWLRERRAQREGISALCPLAFVWPLGVISKQASNKSYTHSANHPGETGKVGLMASMCLQVRRKRKTLKAQCLPLQPHPRCIRMKNPRR